MARFKKLLALLLAAVCVFGACLADTALAFGARVFADPAAADIPADSDYDGIPDAYDSDPNNNVFTGRMKSGHDGTTTVSYTMDYRNFFGDNTVYHPELATVSVVGSAVAYYSSIDLTYMSFDSPVSWAGGIATQAEGFEFMQVLGFEDVVDYNLNHYGDDDICEMIIGHHTVSYNGETKVVVGMLVRGTERYSEEEWSSNFNVGDLARFFDEYDCPEGKSPRQSNDDWTRKTNHRGFDVCATRLMKDLKNYLDEYVRPVLGSMPGAKLTYWLTGHSRGGSVANIMSAYLIDEGEEVYCYTFACPYTTANTEASAEKYDCIFNLLNSNDFVPTMPMPEWGFTRYGKSASVDASQYADIIKTATGETYSGKYLTSSDINTMLNKFICITGVNSDRNNPGKILGWREVYVFHCGHNHADSTNGNYQSTTYCPWGLFGPYENDYYNKYPIRLQKYSFWDGGICETPAYCMQVLVELMVKVANGEVISGASTYITSNKLADKFDFDKWSLVSYATKLTEPHFMDTYSVIQAQINAEGNPGARFHTERYYTATDTEGGRPAHTHTYTYVPYAGHEPTCTEAGLGYRYCACSAVNADYYDDVQKNVVIPATGHAWGEATYIWTEDYGCCTATRVCTLDQTHIETETAASFYEVVTEPTYEAPGLGRYTVVFENEAFGTQTIEVELAQLVPVYHSLTVCYLFEDGTDAAPAYLGSCIEGEPYSVASPEIEGYTADITVVSGIMGEEDLLIVVTYTADEPQPGYLLGDANVDGTVTFADVSFMYLYLLAMGELTPQGIINSDMNCDGSVDFSDIGLLYVSLLFE